MKNKNDEYQALEKAREKMRESDFKKGDKKTSDSRRTPAERHAAELVSQIQRLMEALKILHGDAVRLMQDVKNEK